VPDSKPAGRHLLVSGTNLIYRIEFHSHASEEEANPAVPQPSGSQSDQSLGQPSSDLGANEWLVEEMFDQYQRDPQSVDPVWIAYFKASPAADAAWAAFFLTGRRLKRLVPSAAIGEWTKRRSREDVLAALDAADVPAGRIYSVADIVSDPQYLAREMIVDTPTSDGRPLKAPGIVPKLSATPGRIAHAAPRLGQHTADLQQGGWPERDDPQP